MMYGNDYPKGVKPVSTAKAAGSKIVESRLNAKGDTMYRGKRGSYGKSKGMKNYGAMKGYDKGMDY